MDDNGLVKGVILTADRDAAGPAEWDGCPDLLLPLANRPLVEWILDEYARIGVRATLISAGRDTGEIASLCGDGARWDMTLAYGDARDVPDAPDARDAPDAPAGQRLCKLVREVAAFTKDAPFLVTPGPVPLESEVYARLVQLYREHRPCGIRTRRIAGYPSGISGDDAEKPGIYLMTPRTCEVLVNVANANIHDRPLDNLFDAALDELIGRGETVLNQDAGHPPIDVGSPEAFLASNERMLASGSESVETGLPEIMDDNFSSPNLVMRPPVIVDDTAELERCRIGPGVCIGPGVRIGHGAAIEHSVIMEGADIGDGASISYAVIGRNAGIENRSILHGMADRVIVVRSD